MNINDDQLELLVNNKSKDNTKNNNIVHTIILDLAKIYTIDAKINWYQIEYLSLRHSYIKNIDFINFMPNLFYLDVFQNPIEVYTPLLKSTTYGFLCFSPPLFFFEQKILAIEKINVIFLSADIKDKTIKNNFLIKNPNIFVLNGNIIEFEYKMKLISSLPALRNIFKNISILKNDKSKIKQLERLLIQKDKLIESKFRIIPKENSNGQKIIKIEKFIKDYNDRMVYFHKGNKLNYNPYKVNIEEKKKLIAISDTYINILKLEEKNHSYYKYFPTKEKINIENIRYASLKHDKINISIFKHVVTSLKEFLLSVLILYIFKILSRDISFYLIKTILSKTTYYQLEKDEKKDKNMNKDINDILDLKPVLLITIYYKIYDMMFGIYSNKKLTDIQIKLQMNEIADKVMSVIQHQNDFINLIKNTADYFKKGQVINQVLITFFNQNDIFNNILTIIQYIYYYMIYNSIQKNLAAKYSNDLQFFFDVKNYMYYSIDKKQAENQSMAEKSYNKIQMNSLYNNKYFFDTDNYKKTTQNYLNVFLNYKHGPFLPDKKRIQGIFNSENYEDIKQKEKELITKNYVENNLNSFFSVFKEKNNPNFFSSSMAKNQIKTTILDEVGINLDQISPKAYRIMKFRTPSNSTNLIPVSVKKTLEIDINDKISNTIKNDKNHLLYQNKKMFKTTYNTFKKSKILKYLRGNSMNEVLNNRDFSAKVKKISKAKGNYEKKHKKIKTILSDNLQNKTKTDQKKINEKEDYYYNISLGCKINLKTIILNHNDKNFKAYFNINNASSLNIPDGKKTIRIINSMSQLKPVSDCGIIKPLIKGNYK